MLEKIIITISTIFIYAIIYLLDIKIIKNRNVKNTLEIVLGILFFPALILLLDMWNAFEGFLPNVYQSMTDKYDVLAFMGSYLSTIVSSVLLIIITNKDRQENTKIIQDAQRPYLDVRFPCLKKEFLDDKDKNNTIFFHSGENFDKNSVDEYIAIEVMNQGESVAIIDINNMKIEIKYNFFEKNKDGQKIEKVDVIRPDIHTGIPRLSLGKGQTIIILFLYKELYRNRKIHKANITYSKIIYKDLFNKQYTDECKRNEKGEQIVIQDNKEIVEG